jgi:transcriptional regulator with XRE-family HTH domain
MGTNTTTQRVAANVRAELAARRISGTELAKALKITRSTMYRRLAGASAWPVDDLEPAAKFLGVSVESLMVERETAA